MSRNDIVVFLQNAWFPDGTRASAMKLYAKDLAFRRRVLSESATGRRLLAAFGEVWFNRIHWDNATPIPGIGDHRAAEPYDAGHMAHVIHACRPRVVGLMGLSALNGAEELGLMRDPRLKVFACRHPNAMGVTSEELRTFAASILDVFQAS